MKSKIPTNLQSKISNPQSEALRILILEDVPTDAELVKRELLRAGIAFTSMWVNTREAFLEQLVDFSPDIVLSDYSMPQFTGREALELVKERHPSIPVIMVTGTINEDTAVGCMKAGAVDYVIKENLTRLGQAVERALEKKKLKEQTEKAETALQESEEKYRTLYDSSRDAIMTLTPNKGFLSGNPATVEMFGCQNENEFIFLGPAALSPEYQPDGALSIEKAQKMMEIAMEKGSHFFEWKHKQVDGEEFYATVLLTRMELHGEKLLQATVRDITDSRQANKKLRKSEASLSQAQRIASIGNWEWDIVQNDLYWSNEIYRIFGLKSQELDPTYEAFMDSVHPEDRKRVAKAVDEALNENKPYSIEHRIVLPDGSERFVHEQAEMTFDDVGKPILMIGTVQDVTGLKLAEQALRESEEKYRNLIESTSDWVWACDLEGRQTFANEAVKNILGYEVHEVQGTLAESLMHPENVGQVRKWFKKAVEEKKGWQGSIVHWQHKDGTERFLESTAQPILKPNGDLVGFIGIDRDVTDRKLAEEEREMLYDELKSLNLELENKVKERTAALEIAVLDADKANRAKSNFLASMSHELRTPLNSVIGFSQVLQEKFFGDLNEKQETYINHIMDSGNHLLELINDILDIAKVESGKMELELTRVNIGNLLGNSLVMIKEKALKHAIDLDLHIVPELKDLEITADERKLKQIIFNLLSNAAKFTPDGGSIRLEAKLISDIGSRISELKKQGKIIADQSAIRSRQSAIEICVADSGIGIAPENIEKIFEEFHQVADDTRYKPEGTGLGMAISKQFVEMHGGRIWVESEGMGKGSRFGFIVPIIPEDSKEAKPGAVEGLFANETEAKATLLNHMSRAINLCERQNKPVTFCRLRADGEHLKRVGENLKRVLEAEKRGHDFLLIDQDANLYLILLQTGRQQAKVACGRFSEKLEAVLEGLKVSWSKAVFPDDGKDAATLLEKVGGQPE